MKLLNKNFDLFGKSFSVIILIWFAVAIITSIIQVSKGVSHNNNYLIFKQVFFHTIHQQNLYLQYVNEYGDTNHYGPFFSIIIAPFALLPNWLGMLLWSLANIGILFYAITNLPISETNKKIVLLIGLIELLTSLHNIQFNPMLTAWIILSYTLVKDKKDFWATMFIAAGFMVKLYGIVGLAFFLFSENKIKFIGSFVFWMLLFFAIPMLFSSPQFIIQSYQDWFLSLTEKNSANAISIMQGMTADKVLNKVFNVSFFTNMGMIIMAALVYFATLLKYKLFSNTEYQLYYLASLLIGVVIFSSSAESATFVIAMMGVGIWFVANTNNSKFTIALLIFTLVFTSLSTTDAFPRYIKENFIRPYAIKALPCFIIWLALAFQLLFKKPDNLTS